MHVSSFQVTCGGGGGIMPFAGPKTPKVKSLQLSIALLMILLGKNCFLHESSKGKGCLMIQLAAFQSRKRSPVISLISRRVTAKKIS